MVGVGRRLNKLKALLVIRHGPGAAVLPSGITRIHVEFATRWNEGHFGPRKFWRICLPRLKYWNPAIPMIVNRTRDQSGPATLSIYFRHGSTASSSSPPSATPSATPSAPLQLPSSTEGQSRAPQPEADERVVTIDMKDKHSEQILADFLAKTGAVPVVPTAQEEAEMAELEELRERAAVDAEAGRKMREKKKREDALLAQARSEAAELKADA